MDDLISRQALRSDMYHEAMEKDSEEQRWDGGCWIRYKMFERVIDRQPSAQPEIIRCKECKHFHYDMPYVIQGIPVLGHEVCDFWGDGCKTNENGFCSYAERRNDG